MNLFVINRRRRIIWCVALILALLVGYLIFGIYLKLKNISELSAVLMRIGNGRSIQGSGIPNFSPNALKISYTQSHNADNWMLDAAYNYDAERVEMTLNGKNNTVVGFYIGKNDAGVAVDKSENIYYTFPCKNIRASWEQCMLSDLFKLPEMFPDNVSNADIMHLFSYGTKSSDESSKSKPVVKNPLADNMINAFIDLNIKKVQKGEFRGDVSINTVRQFIMSSGKVDSGVVNLINKITADYVKDTQRVSFSVKYGTNRVTELAVELKNQFSINISIWDNDVYLCADFAEAKSSGHVELVLTDSGAAGSVTDAMYGKSDFDIRKERHCIIAEIRNSNIPGTIKVVLDNNTYYPFESTKLNIRSLGTLKLEKVMKLAGQIE